MCGFIGVVGDSDRDEIASMCGQIAHRGPDDEAYWFNHDGSTPVAFGFRRLSILDVEGGRQPMISADGSLVIVFNGEIYNHRELRHELEGRGHRFETDHSDTEVLLYAYLEWGRQNMCDHLNGMFAFAIFDRTQHLIFLARDRFAKKPLYYSLSANHFIFASELTAVACHSSISTEIDRESLMRYFAFGYIPPPGSLLKGVKKLAGGDFATYHVDSHTIDVGSYWRYRVEASARTSGTEDDWADELRSRIKDSVVRRLDSDVPLGFFLSGGLDSTAILALARDHLGNQPIDTFTMGVADPSYDERRQAEQTSKLFGTRHHQRVLDFEAASELIDGLLQKVDEPIADPSILPTYLVSAFARETVTVAIGGDGGDELFAGYDTFAAFGLARSYAKLMPRTLHPLAQRIAQLLPRRTTNLSFDFKLRRALRGLSYDMPFWQPQWLAPASIEEIGIMFGEPISPERIYGDVLDVWNTNQTHDPRDQLLEYYGNFYLPYDVMAKVDRASMLCSLEVRAPLLDVDVVSFCLSLPYETKHKGRSRKWILRKALSRDLPQHSLRHPKQGFSIPVADWLRRISMPDLARSEEIGINTNYLRDCWRDHQ